MLFLNPQNVALDGAPLDHVRAIAVSRKAHRLVVEYTDRGPHPSFIDVPEQRTTITITRDLTDGEPQINTTIKPGLQTQLTFTTAPNASDAQTQPFTITVVLTDTEVHLGRDSHATHTIRAIAVSPTGVLDPFTTLELPPL